MFNLPTNLDPTLLKNINALRNFYLKNSEAWHMLWATAMLAIKAFKATDTSTDDIFHPQETKHSLDVECDTKFTIITAAFENIINSDASSLTIVKTVSTLPNNIDFLCENLKLFLAKDKDAQRKEKYLEAIKMLEQISSEMGYDPRNPQRSSSVSPKG